MKIRSLDLQQADALGRFIDLPWRLYASHAWVPPLKASIAQELGPENLFFRHGRAASFVAEQAGEIVGRIVASIDDRLATQEIGHFGYFESVDDPEVAGALLQAAEAWLRDQGRSVVHGPVNLNIYTNYRLQTAGFETRPFLGEPRALPYYAGLLEAAGYAPCAGWHSWDISGAQLQPIQGYMAHKLAAIRAAQTHHYQMKTFDPEDPGPDLARLYRLAMAGFAGNYGFASLDFEEFVQVYQGLLLVFRRHPELLGIFYADGIPEPVAFGFAYPDYADFFQQLDGKAAGLQDFPAATAHGMVFHTFAVLPEHRQAEPPYKMFAYGFDKAVEAGYDYAIGALAKEGRTAYDQLGAPTRSYAVFEKRPS